MSGATRSGPPMRPPVDLIVLRSEFAVDFFARNWQGLHVPLSAMSVEELELAQWEDRLRREEKGEGGA